MQYGCQRWIFFSQQSTPQLSTSSSPLPAGEDQPALRSAFDEGGFKILSIYQQSTPQPSTVLSWQSTPGSTYRVLYKNTLEDPEWTDASGDITADDFTTSWNDLTTEEVPSRYYCVLLVQEPG